MAKYKVGIKTQQRTIEVCRHLFYENGYRETSFEMICEQAEINPGTLSYHFGGKAGIAQKIYGPMMASFNNQIAKLVPCGSDLEILLAGLSAHIRLMYDDPNYRRFSIQFCTDCMDQILKDNYKNLTPRVNEYVKSHLSEEKAAFYYTMCVGFDATLNRYISEHMDTLPYENACLYGSELYFYYENIEEIHRLMPDILERIGHLRIKCKDLDITVTTD